MYKLSPSKKKQIQLFFKIAKYGLHPLVLQSIWFQVKIVFKVLACYVLMSMKWNLLFKTVKFMLCICLRFMNFTLFSHFYSLELLLFIGVTFIHWSYFYSLELLLFIGVTFIHCSYFYSLELLLFIGVTFQWSV